MFKKKVSLEAIYWHDPEKKILYMDTWKNGECIITGFACEIDHEPTEREVILQIARRELLGPRSGECYFCKKELDAYETKYQTWDRIAHLGCLPQSEEKSGDWWPYSDG